MITFIRIILFAVSTIGTWELIRRNTKIEICFLPGLSVAVQTCVLFMGGILNVLPMAVYFLYYVGIGTVLFCAKKDKSIKFLKNYINYECIFLMITIMIMAASLRGHIFNHYDNYSHWALVIKRMLTVDRYPNFKDTMIGFQGYPLGASVWIYYFAKMISKSEWIQMTAKAYMMLVSVMPLFFFLRKNRFTGFLFILVSSNFLLCYNGQAVDMLIDDLLPLVGMSGAVYAYAYCKAYSSENKLRFYAVILYLIQLMQIKNSGIFFAVGIGIVILFTGKKPLINCLICFLAPLASYYIWTAHCKYVFSDAALTKHSMTVDNYARVVGSKTADEIRTIVYQMYDFSIHNKSVIFTGAFIIAVILFVIIFNKESLKGSLILSGIAVAIYIVYQIGMLGMYIFSMPVNEAIGLSGVMRYTQTILLAIIYMMLIVVLISISGLKNHHKLNVALMTACMLLIALQYKTFGKMNLAFKYVDVYDQTERIWIEEQKQKYSVPDEESYAILIHDGESTDYTMHLCTYIFQSNKIKSRIIKTAEDMNEIDSKYVFCYDSDNEVIQNWIRMTHPDQEDHVVIIQ